MLVLCISLTQEFSSYFISCKIYLYCNIVICYYYGCSAIMDEQTFPFTNNRVFFIILCLFFFLFICIDLFCPF